MVLLRRVLFCALIFLAESCNENPKPVAFEPDPQIGEVRQVTPLDIDEKVPEFELPAVDGRYYTLADFDDKKVLVVVFLSNHCPLSQVYESRIKDFVEEHGEDVAVIAISPNSPLVVPDDKLSYSDLDDTYQSLVVRAQEKDLNFPYLYDGDNQEVSLKFGPTTLPTVFVFDKFRKLRYRGRLDVAPWRFGGNLEDLRLAVQAIKENREIIRPLRDSPACKVYWSWDQQDKVEFEQKWASAEVTLRKINLDSLKTILVNFSSNIRVINFWATWCGPCKKEFPEFVKMRRMYRGRPVEFFSISLDDIKDQQIALDFLKQLHAPGLNFILDESNKNLIREKVYASWSGALPFTMVIDPLGDIYEVYEGPFNPLQLRRSVVDHRLMGRFLRQ